MRIICTAKLAQTVIGHVDHALAYAAGFARLGHEVFVVDHVGNGRCKNSSGQRVPFEEWIGRKHFEQMVRSYGLWPNACLVFKDGRQTHGMSYAELEKVASRADLLITRSGQIHRLKPIFEGPAVRAFFDGNPASTQADYLSGQAGGNSAKDSDPLPLDRYECLFTLGLNVGSADCPVPTAGLKWQPLVRPVFLPHWPKASEQPTRGFTTISTWKGRATVQLGEVRSGQKSDNWERFIALPHFCKQPLGIALKLTGPNSYDARQFFVRNGWQLEDPAAIRSREDYAEFIRSSIAELSVAHERYVKFNTGWFSDRSALYLASGRPVLVQSTGIESHLPTGLGIVTFNTFAEALAGLEEIGRNYTAHRNAAREIAEAYFDSDKVLNRVLEIVTSSDLKAPALSAPDNTAEVVS